MQPIDNSQFSEEQRAEAYRQATMQHMERQTKALEKIKGTLDFFLIVFIIGVVLAVILLLVANS